jgi:dihydrofolate synthase/folylpolyglutamate synthase
MIMGLSESLDAALSERDAALRFLYGRVDYERVQSFPYDAEELKLDRMRQLLHRLGSPQRDLPVVHVAGTKGKGSTSAMLAGILTAAGYRTGLFTSPHLERIEERLAIDGRICSPDELVDLLRQVQPVVEAMDREGSGWPCANSPTFFEITTAMALLYFASHKTGAVVLEVGLGGRLDSTNVCRPRVSVITSISLDHMRQLGNTMEAIAWEKAGIIKPGVPLVSGVATAGPREVIRWICRRRHAPLAELGLDFGFEYTPPLHVESAPAMGTLDFHYHSLGRGYDFPGLSLGLLGRHQAANAATALATLDELERSGWTIPEEAVRAGLAGLHWPARVELLGRRPTIIVDAAHNVASVEALLATLGESFAADRRFLLFATTREKDVRGMLQRLLPGFDEIVFTRYLNNPRAVPAEELAAIALQLTGRQYPIYADPLQAWRDVRTRAGADDLICVTGSFFIAAEIRRALAVN